MHYLVTGSAGFIGFHLARRLLSAGHSVTGIDPLGKNAAGLRRHRHQMLAVCGAYTPVDASIGDPGALAAAAKANPPEVILHLAARAGVRQSMAEPAGFAEANLLGTLNMLELARAVRPKHFINASTSSVYGESGRPEFAETDPSDQPVSVYAATKKGGEALAHAYAHLFGLPVTTARFFTVYGPWGRPDMAVYRFTETIEAGEPIEVFGDGSQLRDFTYVDDLVWAICALAEQVPEAGRPVTGATDSLSANAPYRAVNIAAGKPVSVNDLIGMIEKALGKPASRLQLPAQPGDVTHTSASTALLKALTGYVPHTPLEEGVRAFVDWYRGYSGRSDRAY